MEYSNRQNDNANTDNGNPTSPTLTATMQKFDTGFNGGIGYRLGRVRAQLGYGLGLVNFVPNDADGQDIGSKGYHRGFQLNATYFFVGK